MASCVRNIRFKNYQNLIIGYKVTVKNVGAVFLRHSVISFCGQLSCSSVQFKSVVNSYCVATASLCIGHYFSMATFNL